MEYVRIVDVSLCHEYYNGSSCGFNVVPSAETAEIMKREQILCRIYDGKVRLSDLSKKPKTSNGLWNLFVKNLRTPL